MVSFITLCDAYRVIAGNPIEESFESAEAPSPCFSIRKANDNPNEMVHGSEMSFSGNNSFRFSSYQPASDYNQYLISPLLEAEDSVTLRFRYCDLMYGNERLRVGYSVAGNSIDDFVWTDTLTTTGIMWKLFKRDYPSNTRFLAINYCSDYRYYAFVDSLQISVVASVDCQVPVITSVTEDTESITVCFDAEGSVEAYITDQSWNDNASGVTVAGNRYTFAGLQPNTEYTIGLRNHCTSGISSRWTTRRVLTSAENCPAPNGFVLEDNGYSTATFSWSGDAHAWEINLYNLSYDQTFRVTESPFTVTGLYNDITYHARIRSLCDGLPGSWCDTVITFSTLLCEPVSNLESQVIDVDSGVVLLTWQSQVGQYVLDYGLEHFTVGGGTTVSGITDEYYRLEGLIPGETYDYYVRAQCDESSYSIYSQRGVFTLSREGILEVRNDIEMLLYPNPATGTTTLSIGGVQEYLDIRVMDVCGRVVKSTQMFCPDGCKMQLSLGHLRSGVYFVHIAGQSVNRIEKLIVK